MKRQRGNIKKSELEILKDNEKLLQAQIQENRGRQKVILTEKFLKDTGYNIGDTVEWQDGNKVHKGVLKALTYWGNMEPRYWIIQLYNNNGELGLRERHIYDSKKILRKII